MTPEGQILSQWAGRSIIKSCAKLAYGHAQDMIEGSFQGLPDQEPPPVELHGCAWPQVLFVLRLHNTPVQKCGFLCVLPFRSDILLPRLKCFSKLAFLCKPVM